MRKEGKRSQEQYIREIRKKRKRLLEKKARKERRDERLAKLAIWLMGLGIWYLFTGVIGLVTVAVYAFVRYFIIGAEEIFEE